MNIVKSIYNEPEKWRLTEHWFIHDEGARVWIANGLPFIDINGAKVGIIQKFKIFKAYRWWVTNAPIEALGRRR